MHQPMLTTSLSQVQVSSNTLCIHYNDNIRYVKGDDGMYKVMLVHANLKFKLYSDLVLNRCLPIDAYTSTRRRLCTLNIIYCNKLKNATYPCVV